MAAPNTATQTDLARRYENFAAIPTTEHVMCSVNSSEPAAVYAEGPSPRIMTTFWAFTILGPGTSGDGNSCRQYMQRVGDALGSCQECVTNWHRYRTAFLSKAAE